MNKQLMATQSQSLTEQDILGSYLPTDKRRVELNMNFLMRLRDKNPELVKSDFLDFVGKCQAEGADPMRDQAYLTTFKSQVYSLITSKKEWTTYGVTIFAYDFFISKAESHEQYSGFDIKEGFGEYFNPVTGEITNQIYAEVSVYRKDRERPIVYRAWYPECVNRTKEGRPNSFWLKSPYAMTRKCAIARGFKQAFPKELGNFNVSGVDDVRSIKEVDLSEGEYLEVDKKTEVKAESKVESKVEPKVEKKVDRDIEATSVVETEEATSSTESGLFVISFGKYSGKKLEEVPLIDLKNLHSVIKDGMKNRKPEDISKEVRDFYEQSEKYMKGRINL